MSERKQRGLASIVNQESAADSSSSGIGRQNRLDSKGKGKLVRIPTLSPAALVSNGTGSRRRGSRSRSSRSSSSSSSHSYNSSIAELPFEGPQRANTPAPQPSGKSLKREVSWSTPHILLKKGLSAALTKKHHNHAAEWFASENRAGKRAGKQVVIPHFWRKREPDGSLECTRIFFDSPPKYALAKFKHHHHGVPTMQSYEIVGTDGIGVIKLLNGGGKLVPSALDDQWITVLHRAFNHRAFDALPRDLDPKVANFYMLFCSGCLYAFYPATEQGKVQCEKQMKRLLGKESSKYIFPVEWAAPLVEAFSKAHERKV